jgi:hypothetical protein
MAFSLPKDEDVPLRAWYEEHGLGQPTGAPSMNGDPMAPGTSGLPAAPSARPGTQRVASSAGARMDA